MIITDEVKIEFFKACKEAAFFVQSEENKAHVMAAHYEQEFYYHCMSFLHRAWVFYIAENNMRDENAQPPKMVECLAQDFILSACGHGAGFFERGVSDWIYYGDVLEDAAGKYLAPGYIFMANSDGELIGSY